MTNSSVFVLDTNVFIEASRRYYAFDLVGSFWTQLITHAEEGSIRSIRGVKDELLMGKDKLADWVKTNFEAYFYEIRSSETNAYKKIINWVQNHKDYSDVAKENFANDVDGWLVAYAMANGYVVVTHEVSKIGEKRRVSIPSVCDQFGVRYVNTFEMLRELGIRLS